MSFTVAAVKSDNFQALTLCAGRLVQVCEELAHHFLVSSQCEGVGQKGRGVQVVQLAGRRLPQTAQTLLYRPVLSQTKRSCRLASSRQEVRGLKRGERPTHRCGAVQLEQGSSYVCCEGHVVTHSTLVEVNKEAAQCCNTRNDCNTQQPACLCLHLHAVVEEFPHGSDAAVGSLVPQQPPLRLPNVIAIHKDVRSRSTERLHHKGSQPEESHPQVCLYLSESVRRGGKRAERGREVLQFVPGTPHGPSSRTNTQQPHV